MTLRSCLAALAALCLALPVAAQEGQAITILKQGSFSIGGSRLEGEDGAQQSCDHGYIEYQVPLEATGAPLFFWHSSSTAVWQNNWIGNDGFQSIFLRRGHPVFLWDGPRVGRANWGCVDQSYTASAGRDQQNFTSWRLGPAWMQWFEGVQFPAGNRGALERAMRARYNEFDRLENVRLEAGVAADALQSLAGGTSQQYVAVTSSAGGLRALLAATQTDGIAAIVAYENPGYLFPAGEGPGTPDGPFGPMEVSEDEFARLLTIPMQFVWGDNIEGHAIWSAKLEECRQFVALINARGGQAEILMLEDAGLTGNTHMPFADLNNLEVAALMEAFLVRNGLAEASATP